MDIDIRRFNDGEYFKQLLEFYSGERFDGQFTDPISEAIKGVRDCWICLDRTIQTDETIIKTRVKINGFEIHFGKFDWIKGMTRISLQPLQITNISFGRCAFFINGGWHIIGFPNNSNRHGYYQFIFARELVRDKFLKPFSNTDLTAEIPVPEPDAQSLAIVNNELKKFFESIREVNIHIYDEKNRKLKCDYQNSAYYGNGLIRINRIEKVSGKQTLVAFTAIDTKFKLDNICLDSELKDNKIALYDGDNNLVGEAALVVRRNPKPVEV